jgi:ketosteroid isomerase-like protein
MSEENVAVIREAYRAWLSGGLDALLERLDPEFEFEEDPHFPEAGARRRRAAFGAYGRQFMAAWETWEFDLKEIREAAGGDRVLTRFIIRGRSHESGLETELEVGWVWTVRDGRPTHARAYLELADALRATGLNE